MSLSHTSQVYERQKEDADRDYRGYGFILALVCVALALVLASAILTPANVGSGIDYEASLVSP